MWSLFFLIILFILVLSLKYIFRDQISKIVVYCFVLYWFISLLVSSFNPYYMFDVSDETYLILTLSVLSFLVGFSLVKIRKSNLDLSLDKMNIERLILNKYIWILYLVSLIFIIYIYIRNMDALILLYEANQSREELYRMTFENNALLSILYGLFAAPLFHIYIIISCYLFFFNKKMFKYILPFSFYIVIYSFIGGGRLSFMIIVLYMVFFYLMKRSIRNRNINNVTLVNKETLIFIFIVACIFVVMSKITYERYNKGEYADSFIDIMDGANILCKAFITYSTAPFRLFDYALANNMRDQLDGKYILSSFEGLYLYFENLFALFGYKYDYIQVHNVLQDTWVYVGDDPENKVYNYAFTAVFYHYLDLGIFGALIFPLCFGIFFRICIRKFYFHHSICMLILILFLFFMTIHSVFTCYLIKFFTIPFCAFLYIASNKNKIKKIYEN